MGRRLLYIFHNIHAMVPALLFNGNFSPATNRFPKENKVSKGTFNSLFNFCSKKAGEVSERIVRNWFKKSMVRYCQFRKLHSADYKRGDTLILNSL